MQAGIFICLLVGWMSVIFSFSAQKAVQSSHMSQGVSYRLVEKVEMALHLNWEEERIEKIADTIEFPVRKAAHMTEYAILGCLFLGSFIAWNTCWKRKVVLAQLATLCYAASDEFHQTFVAGRDGSLRDVLIDGAGCLIALFVLSWIHRTKRKGKENHD